MKKELNNRPPKLEISNQEQIELTINQLRNCPRDIKEADLQVFKKHKQQCEDFINDGVVNGMMQMKAQMKMMTLSEYCPVYLDYLNGVIAYLERELV